jgi:hypothetical protein
MLNYLRYKRINNVLAVSSFVFFLSSCENNDRKEKLETALNIIHVDSSQQIIEANELAGLYSKERTAYDKTFHDSSIFILGNIQRIDKEHGEILLRNKYGKDIVCLMKDSTTLQFLKRSDRVLFKGVCKAGPEYGVILIGQCEIAQIKNNR